MIVARAQKLIPGQRIKAVWMLRNALVFFGHKPLLEFYCNDHGEALLLTKNSAGLNWFFEASQAPKAEKVISFYIRRYGIDGKAVKNNVHIL